MPEIVYGADDPKAGAVSSIYQLVSDPRANHRAQVTAGIMADPCGDILRQFFSKQRQLGKNKQTKLD